MGRGGCHNGLLQVSYECFGVIGYQIVATIPLSTAGVAYHVGKSCGNGKI